MSWSHKIWDDGIIEAALEYNDLSEEDFGTMGEVECIEFLNEYAENQLAGMIDQQVDQWRDAMEIA